MEDRLQSPKQSPSHKQVGGGQSQREGKGWGTIRGLVSQNYVMGGTSSVGFKN